MPAIKESGVVGKPTGTRRFLQAVKVKGVGRGAVAGFLREHGFSYRPQWLNCQEILFYAHLPHRAPEQSQAKPPVP